MGIKFKIGDLIKISPYEGNEQIIVVGVVRNIARSWFSKKQFIRIKGIKFNTYKEVLYFSYTIWEYDFNKIKLIKSLI